MNSKEKAYERLVKKRKKFIFPQGLKNPSEIKDGIYDKETQIGPWSKWQGNLNADIMLIGQDWGDIKFFIKCEGGHLDNSITNQNLRKLFESIEIDVGYPDNPNKEAPVFFTNAVLGLKEDGMTGKIKNSWVEHDAKIFLKPNIDIVQPKILITLGKKAYEALTYIYPIKNDNLKNLINKNPIKLNDGKILFAMYHSGHFGMLSRNLELQKTDWKKIKRYIKI